MTKSEFLSRLRAALNGRVSPGVVAENINYYEDYINSEVRKGRREDEVLASLGDPRLIARTIVETSAGSGNRAYQGNEDGASYREYGQQRQAGQQGWYGGNAGAGGYGQQAGGHGGRASHGRSVFRVPVWVWVLALVLIVVFVFSIFFSILSFLMPILLPILVVVFLVKLFRDWLN